jgi:hypothetical protein
VGGEGSRRGQEWRVMEEQLEQTGQQKEQPSLQDHLTMWRCRRGMMMRIIEYDNG